MQNIMISFLSLKVSLPVCLSLPNNGLGKQATSLPVCPTPLRGGTTGKHLFPRQKGDK